jgi:hypothetical protein
VETRTCALDSSHTETRDIAIDPNAHVLGNGSTIIKAATCTEDGIASGICTLNSSHVLNNSPISALGHDYGNWTQTTAPTCTAAGIDTGTCSRDSSTTTRTGAAALGHDYQWVSTATATTDGTEILTCAHDNTHTSGNSHTAYATGTSGLAFEAIGSPVTAYRVRKGTVTTGAVHIPAYHRPNANSTYLLVTEIGASNDDNYYNQQGAFTDVSITSVTIPTSVTSIGGRAFYQTNLASVTIPASVTSIGDYAFFGCDNLTSITIPAGVTSIGESTFAVCINLTSITVDAGNPNYSSDNGILYNKAKTTLIQAPVKKSGAVTIPASVTSIGIDAFRNCNITSITIPAGVTSIGENAFQMCKSLTSITIPAGVTSISNSAFAYCTFTSITIPAGVTSIGSSAFWECNSLTSVTFAGTIASDSFSTTGSFKGDLRTKFYATDSANGTPGTYTRSGSGTTQSPYVWTRQP